MVQKGHVLRFSCTHCHQPVEFSVLDPSSLDGVVVCSHCHMRYSFEDETLQRQLKKFEALCRQIVTSEEILSDASVGIDVSGHQVQVPYRLLLARFNSILDLDIGGKPFRIEFRLEPLKDHPK